MVLGKKPLPEPMLTQFQYVIWRRYDTLWSLKNQPNIYTGPINVANRGFTLLCRIKAELVPQSPHSWPALKPWLSPIAGRCKPQFNQDPDSKAHGANMGPTRVPRWAPCWPHKPCYQGNSVNCGFTCKRRFPSVCRSFKQLGQDTQAVNPASIQIYAR